jgi:MFS family permease
MPGQSPSELALAKPSVSRIHATSLFLLLAIFLANFVGRILPGPLMPVIEEELQIGHGTAGAYFLVLSIGYSVTLFLGQTLSSRLSHKQIITLSSIGVGIVLIGNLLISTGRGLFAFFLLLGIVSGLYLPSGITLTTAVVAASSWGLGIAIHELAPSIGYLTVPILAEGTLKYLSWRLGLALVGGFSVVMGIMYFIFGRGSDLYGTAISIRTIRELLGKKMIRIIAALFGLAMAVNYGLYVMLPLYLVAERGWEREAANVMISFSRLPALIGMLIAGWAADRIGPKPIIWTSLFLSGLASVSLSVAPSSWLAYIIPAQALLVVSFFPAGFALLSQETQLGGRNVGVALITALSTLFGQGLVPLLLGILGEIGSFSLAIAAVGIAAMAGAFLIRSIKESHGTAS